MCLEGSKSNSEEADASTSAGTDGSWRAGEVMTLTISLYSRNAHFPLN